MGKLHIIDVSIVGIYLLLCLIIGLYKSTKIKTIREYAIGSGNFSTFIIISTMFATFISANATLGFVEQIYKLGLVFAIAMFFMPFNWLIIKNIYAKNIDKFKGCISISEMMGSLYGNVGLYFTSLISLITAIVFVAIQVTAIGYLFNYFFNFTYIKGIFIGVGILTLYSTFGGIRAVALTDVFQFLIFFFALPLACGYAYHKAGGYNNIINSLPKSHLTIFSDVNSSSLFFSYIILMILPAIAAPYAQRLLMAKNKTQLLKSYNILIFAAIFFACIIFILGFSIRSLYPDIEPKIALYHFIYHLPSVFIGLLISGMLAVIMSSADSWLNSASVIIAHDVIKKIFPNIDEKQELLVAKLATLACAVLAVIIALISGEIFELMILVQAFAYAAILVPFTVGFFNFKTSNISFIFSVIVGFSFTILAKLLTGKFGIISLVIGVLGSTIGFFGAHYWQVKREIIKIKKSSYKQYKPTLCQKIKQSIDNFVAIKRKVEVSKSSYYIFALFIMTLNIPILMLGHNSFNDFVNITVLYLRYITLFLGLLLMFHELYSTKSPNILWNTILFLTLPFAGVYFFIVSGYSAMWGINCFVSIIALFLFANLYYASLLGISGILIAIAVYVGYYFAAGSEVILHKYLNTDLFATYSTVLLSAIVIYIIYHKFRKDVEKQRALEIIGRSIAHDVTLPLTINLMGIELIKQSLKDEDYKNIVKHIHNLEQCNIQAIQDIDIMLSSIKAEDSAKPKDWGQYSIIKSVNHALDKYFMNEEQKKQISFLDKNNKSDCLRQW